MTGSDQDLWTQDHNTSNKTTIITSGRVRTNITHQRNPERRTYHHYLSKQLQLKTRDEEKAPLDHIPKTNTIDHHWRYSYKTLNVMRGIVCLTRTNMVWGILRLQLENEWLYWSKRRRLTMIHARTRMSGQYCIKPCHEIHRGSNTQNIPEHSRTISTTLHHNTKIIIEAMLRNVKWHAWPETTHHTHTHESLG
jgi:hypothetical protein